MKKEEKLLVIKDLCARLPYGIRVKHGRTIIVLSLSIIFGIITDGTVPKPYLRPMSSMTEEEEWKYNYIKENHTNWEVYDYLNSIHIDYRGLIKKGLALEAPEGIYNI